MEEFYEPDFSELYADVEVQASSAINAMHGRTDMPPEDDGIFGNAIDGFLQFPSDDDDDFFENPTGGEQEEGNGFFQAGGAAGDDGIYESFSRDQVRGWKQREEEEEGGEEEGLTNLPMENGDSNETGSESEDDLNIVLEDDGNRNKQNYGDKFNYDKNIVCGTKNLMMKHGGEEEIEKNEIKSGGNYGNENSSNGEDFSLQRKGMELPHSVAFPLTFNPIVGGSGGNFSLPRSRTVLDVNIDSIERKRWREPGSDITDFFNFGFDEDSWKCYCSDLKKFREARFMRMPVPKFPQNTKIYPKEKLSKMHKSSRSILAEGYIGKPHPSSDDVLIQDLREDSLNSKKKIVDGMEKLRKPGKNKDTDMEDEEGRRNFASKRGSRHIITCNSVSLEQDNKYGRMQISDSEENDDNEESDCDSDEAMETSDSRNRKNTSIISNKVGLTKSSLKSRSGNEPGFSCSVSSWVEPNDDEMKKGRKNSKKHPSNSVSELQGSVTCDYNPSRNSKSHNIKSRSKNHTKEELHKRSNPVSNPKDNLSDEDPCLDTSNQETVIRGKKRVPLGFDSNENDMQRFFAQFGGFFPDYPLWPAFLKQQYWNAHPNFGYEEGWCNDPNMNENRNFLERKRAKMEYKSSEENWRHVETRREISPDFEESRPRYSSYRGRGGQFSRRRGGMQFGRRNRYRDFSPVRGYRNDFTRGRYKRYMSPGRRDTDRFEHRYHRNIPRDRREIRNPGRERRRCDSPYNSSESSWRVDNEKRRYFRNRNSYKETHGPSRERFHVRPSWKERERENEWYDTKEDMNFENWELVKRRTTNISDTKKKIMNSHDSDLFIKRRNHQEPEMSNWNEEEYESGGLDSVMFTSEGPSCYFERISRAKRVDDVREHVDEGEVDDFRYKQMREGDCSNEFDQSSKVIHPDGFKLVNPRYQDSADRQMIVGGKKSSRRMPEFRDDAIHKGSFALTEWADDQEPENFRELNDSSSANVVLTNEGNVDSDLSDKSWHDKFFDIHPNEFMDIEEGQIVPEENKEKPFENLIASEATTDQENMEQLQEMAANGERLDDWRIQETIGEMGIGMEGFTDPIALDGDSGNNSKSFSDLDIETSDGKLGGEEDWLEVGQELLLPAAGDESHV